MQRVNEHCCDSRGVKPDIRHPDLTCLPIHHRLSFLSVLLLPLTPPLPPPLLLDSPGPSSVPRSPVVVGDRPPWPRVMRLEYGRCASSTRFWYTGNLSFLASSFLIYFYPPRGRVFRNVTASENLTPFPPELLPRICPIFCPFLLFNLFQSQVKFLFF